MAATGPGDSLWADSSRGPAVDVSMPGSCVHVAAYAERDPIVRTGHGTSFAVRIWPRPPPFGWPTTVRDSLVEHGAKRIQAAFLALLR